MINCKDCKHWVKVKQEKHSGICKNNEVGEMISVSTLFHPNFLFTQMITIGNFGCVMGEKDEH